MSGIKLYKFVNRIRVPNRIPNEAKKTEYFVFKVGDMVLGTEYTPVGVNKLKDVYKPMVLVSDRYIIPPSFIKEVMGAELTEYVTNSGNEEVREIFKDRIVAEQEKVESSTIKTESMSDELKEKLKKTLNIDTTKYFASGMLLGLTGMLILGTFTSLSWWKAAAIGIGGGLVTGAAYSYYKKNQDKKEQELETTQK